MPFDEVRDSLGGHPVIPRSVRANEHRRSMATNAQAADLGAVTGVFPRRQAVVLDLLLKHFPRGHAFFRRATVWPGTQEHVPPIAADANLRRDFLPFLRLVTHLLLPH